MLYVLNLKREAHFSVAGAGSSPAHPTKAPAIQAPFRKAAGGTHPHLYSSATTSAAVFCYTGLGISGMTLWYLSESQERYVTSFETVKPSVTM